MKGPSKETIENYRKGCFTDKKPEGKQNKSFFLPFNDFYLILICRLPFACRVHGLARK